VNRRPLVNVAQSVHQRLLTRARKEERPFNELSHHYAIERFSYRLGQPSPYGQAVADKRCCQPPGTSGPGERLVLNSFDRVAYVFFEEIRFRKY